MQRHTHTESMAVPGISNARHGIQTQPRGFPSAFDKTLQEVHEHRGQQERTEVGKSAKLLDSGCIEIETPERAPSLCRWAQAVPT